MPSSTQSEPAVDSLPANLLVEAPTIRPASPKNEPYPDGQTSVGKRAMLALVRFLIIFCIGVSATLAWQSYSDPVREMIASSYPQLSWLAPQAEPVSLNAPDVIGLASQTASSPDQRQPNALSLDLDAVRRDINRIAASIASSQEQMTSSADRIATSQQQIAHSVDRIATSQEQMTHSLDQLMADRDQMTREIVNLERSILSKNSETSPRPAPAPAPKPVARPASAPAAKPLSPATPEPTVR